MVDLDVLFHQFFDLHHQRKLLVLGNAWDVVSARILESLGYEAIGTSSAGIASVLGYGDGEQMSLEENCEMLQRIASKVKLPVSADIEAGYCDSTVSLVQNIDRILQTGVVGINLEDSNNGRLLPVDTMVERIRAIKKRCEALDRRLFVNLRTDALLLSQSKIEDAVQEATLRGVEYARAGADGVFVPEMKQLSLMQIADLVNTIPIPLNLIIGPDSHPLAALADVGVARVSVGPRVMRMMLTRMQSICRDVLRSDLTPFAEASLSYDDINRLLDG